MLLIRSFIGVNMSNSILDETFSRWQIRLAYTIRTHYIDREREAQHIWFLSNWRARQNTAQHDEQHSIRQCMCVCRRIDDVYGQYFSFITVDISNNILCKWSICFQLFGNFIRLNHFDSKSNMSISAQQCHYNKANGNYQCELVGHGFYLQRSRWRERVREWNENE